MKNFILAILVGMSYVAILTVGSVSGLVAGLWGEADRLARMWEIRWDSGRRRGKIPFPPEFIGAMYWIIRVFAFFLQLVVLTILFHFLLIGFLDLVY